MTYLQSFALATHLNQKQKQKQQNINYSNDFFISSKREYIKVIKPKIKPPFPSAAPDSVDFCMKMALTGRE